MSKQQNTNIIQFPNSAIQIDSEDGFGSVRNRVAKLIESRYSAEVQFFTRPVSPSENSGQAYKFDINDELCPFKHVLVFPEAQLSDHQVKQIKGLLEDLFVPAARMYYQNSLLDRYEEHMTAEQITTPMKPKKPAPQQILPQEEEAMQLPFRSMVLESENPKRLQKFAYDIHDVTGHFAILRWDDVKSKIFSTQDLAQLVGCTLFIESIETLSLSDVAIIWDYLKNHQQAEGPLLLIGTEKPIKEVVTSQSFSPEFAEDISRYRLSVDRLPVSNIDMRELLELF